MKMLSKKSIDKLITIAVITGSSYTIGIPTLAQSYFFPSASFFTPFAAPYESEGEDLAAILEQYPTFSANLKQAGLWDEITSQQSLTIFAPSDRAFAALSPEIQAKLAKPENLKQVLQYHLVSGKIAESDIKRRAVATQLPRNSVEIIGVPSGDKVNVKLNDASASEPLASSDGGVIIPIDRVLIPAGF
jgi:uncharacterized surface protein with fasciclin (FAS1) repeats